MRHMDTQISLYRKGTATRDAFGGVSYATTTYTLWAFVEFISANAGAGAEFSINYDAIKTKEIAKLVTRNDIPAIITDTFLLNGNTYEVANVVSNIRSGLQEIYGRRIM